MQLKRYDTNSALCTNSASGAVSGKLVYVNYGRESDFNYLDYTNISCKGKIVMLRYGRISEANKVSVEFSFILCII